MLTRLTGGYAIQGVPQSQRISKPKFNDPYLGTIQLFSGTFVPRYWADCRGQVMQISQNTALFSLIGITFGGDGQTTFKLPNLVGVMTPTTHAT
jgi:microcystin-dependent protein